MHYSVSEGRNEVGNDEVAVEMAVELPAEPGVKHTADAVVGDRQDHTEQIAAGRYCCSLKPL